MTYWQVLHEETESTIEVPNVIQMPVMCVHVKTFLGVLSLFQNAQTGALP